MVHGYAHANDRQQTSKNESKSTNHSELCGKCVSLAGLGAAVNPQTHVFHITTGQFQLSTDLPQSIISQPVFTYNSRAPPQ